MTTNDAHERTNPKKLYHPSESYREQSLISSLGEYQRLYKLSIENPVKFWRDTAIDNFYWNRVPSEENFLNYNFDLAKGSIYVEWMKGAQTNICYNAVDRIIEQGQGDKCAYIWEGNTPGETKKMTYNELKARVCKFSNVLKSFGVERGSRVAIYMPVTIELAVAMLGCARIGAVHTVVFAGFSAEALANRMLDAKCMLLITADGYYRGRKLILLKEIATEALKKCTVRGYRIAKCIVHRRVGLPVIVIDDVSSPLSSRQDSFSHLSNQYILDNNSKNSRTTKGISWNCATDVWWHEVMKKEARIECEPVWVDTEDPLFILYTSGSTGKPKGVVHTTCGYMVYAATTFKYVFNYQGDDIFFCTADLGWITGHTVNVYGSLCNGATVVLFEGTPFHPDPGRLWRIVDRHRVNTFYTAPTAIRSLMAHGESQVTKSDRSSLKLLGTAGEPINPEAWHWYYDVVGNGRCPIVDTFWQTETSAPMLTALPGATPLKPGSATLPFFGVQPAVVDESGKELADGPAVGHLVFKSPWPGMMCTIDNDHDRFETTYFSQFPGYYATGDHVRRDEDGYYWILGRADDMLNVSGHLLSTAEVESALAEHRAVAEAAAVAFPHRTKGQALYCYVVLRQDFVWNDEMSQELRLMVRYKIGALASPDEIRCVKQLPKTRSGKTMRRILRKACTQDYDLGDVSTIAEPSALIELFPALMVEPAAP